MRYSALVPIALCFVLAACGKSENAGNQTSETTPAAAPAAPASTEPVVMVDGGMIRGSVDDGVVSYLGIPYAAPPVGDLRWMPPQPVAGWDGVRDATKYGSECVQGSFGPPPAGGAAAEPRGNEDCLYLNVWAPADAAGKKLPVMLWVHGGAYVLGSGSQPMYEGTGFAKSGVILVTINYRLGNLGFFAHPTIDAGRSDADLGNYAFMDQREALKWVQNNIAAFGGDPGNVTLFGQSAGGSSVGFLMTMPSTKGLYQKVIIESGSIRSAVKPLKGDDSAEAMGVQMAKALGLDNATAEQLRALPAGMVMGGAASRFMPGPIMDGTEIKGPTYKELADGDFNHTPVMIGANSYEVSIMRGAEKAVPKALGKNLDAAMKLYDGYGQGSDELKMKQIAGDIFMVDGTRVYAESLAKAGVPTYAYFFDYVPSFQRANNPGTGHIMEIPFAFDTVSSAWAKQADDEDKAYAMKVHPYWVAFAKSSDPNGDDRPNWPQFDNSSKTMMYFGPMGPEAKPHLNEARWDFLENHDITSLNPGR